MYSWRAIYSDGTVLEQTTPSGFVSADDIDRRKVVSMSLLRNNIVIVTLHLDQGQRLIYRKRVNKCIGAEDEVCHILGWRQTVDEKVIKSICYYFEDGRIELAGQFKEGHPWFYSPTLREFEV